MSMTRTALAALKPGQASADVIAKVIVLSNSSSFGQLLFHALTPGFEISSVLLKISTLLPQIVVILM